MISRMWHGVVPAGKADEYLVLMRDTGLTAYKNSVGNRGAWCMVRREGERVHFEMLSFWHDVDSVKAFAGEQFERTRSLDFDADFLIDGETTVHHYGVFES